jgi:hypothetical protein
MSIGEVLRRDLKLAERIRSDAIAARLGYAKRTGQTTTIEIES